MNRAIPVLLACLAASPALAQFQPAWEHGNAKHPTLGAVEFAASRRLHETPVGNDKVYSRTYLSCQKEARLLAIELTNMSSPTDTGGLQPAGSPKLACVRKDGSRQEIAAKWAFNKIGDALARGFKPDAWRECRAIAVTQEVILGPGWAAKTAKVEFDIDPASRELDPLYQACGAIPMVATAPASPPAPAPMPAPAPPPVSKLPAPTPPPLVATAPAQGAPPVVTHAAPDDPGAWRPVRTITIGKSNVRAGPSIDTPIVMQLHPGSVLQAQAAGKDWWKVKPPNGAPYGYVREDRLTFR